MARRRDTWPPKKKDPKASEKLDRMIADLRQKQASGDNYRERSLKLHGWICAKCGREFSAATLQQLTVHHRDGNHNHNPVDGSNWENLCIACHDDEHSRGLLADYLDQAE